jgi:hypothetical protein
MSLVMCHLVVEVCWYLEDKMVVVVTLAEVLVLVFDMSLVVVLTVIDVPCVVVVSFVAVVVVIPLLVVHVIVVVEVFVDVVMACVVVTTVVDRRFVALDIFGIPTVAWVVLVV